MNGSLEETNNSALLSMSSTDFKLNSLHEYLYGSLWSKIGYFWMIFICHIVGPILLSGIVMFETFGGDPQKRNVINRLLSLCCINRILMTSLLGICRVWRELFGLIDVQIMTWIEGFGQFFGLNVIFFVTEMTILRFLYIVVWKRVRVFDDGFWTLFISLLTCSWSLCLTIISKYSSQMSLIWFKINTANLSEDFDDIR